MSVCYQPPKEYAGNPTSITIYSACRTEYTQHRTHLHSHIRTVHEKHAACIHTVGHSEAHKQEGVWCVVCVLVGWLRQHCHWWRHTIEEWTNIHSKSCTEFEQNCRALIALMYLYVCVCASVYVFMHIYIYTPCPTIICMTKLMGHAHTYIALSQLWSVNECERWRIGCLFGVGLCLCGLKLFCY